MKILVDADACPVKDTIDRIAGRRGVPVHYVCALSAFRRNAPGVTVEIVEQGPDAADERIAELCEPGDLVITNDIPLASHAVARGGYVIDERGRELDDRNVADRSALRDLLADLRDRGEASGGPPPFTPADRKRFSAALAQALDRLNG